MEKGGRSRLLCRVSGFADTLAVTLVQHPGSSRRGNLAHAAVGKLHQLAARVAPSAPLVADFPFGVDDVLAGVGFSGIVRAIDGTARFILELNLPVDVFTGQLLPLEEGVGLILGHRDFAVLSLGLCRGFGFRFLGESLAGESDCDRTTNNELFQFLPLFLILRIGASIFYNLLIICQFLKGRSTRFLRVF